MIPKIVWRIVIILVLIIVSVFAYLVYDNYLHDNLILRDIDNSKKTSTSTEVLSPPLELTRAYDASDVAGKFRVNDLNYDKGQVALIYEWPPTKKGIIINPILRCNSLDTKVIEQGSQIPSYVTNQKLLQTIRDNPKNNLLFSGLCESNDCEVITGSCELYLNGGIKE